VDIHTHGVIVVASVSTAAVGIGHYINNSNVSNVTYIAFYAIKSYTIYKIAHRYDIL
jgi:hypothetical protein